MMWFIARINFDDDSCEIVSQYEELDQCWSEYRGFLQRPQTVEGGALRICEARDRARAIEKVRSQRREDIEVAATQKGTPDRVVRRWAKSYGIDMDAAAKLTTERLRGGSSKEEWIELEGKRLRELQYDPGDGKGSLIKHTMKGNEYATVVFSRPISTREGKTRIVETYQLKHADGKWLIDEIENSV